MIFHLLGLSARHTGSDSGGGGAKYVEMGAMWHATWDSRRGVLAAEESMILKGLGLHMWEGVARFWGMTSATPITPEMVICLRPMRPAGSSTPAVASGILVLYYSQSRTLRVATVALHNESAASLAVCLGSRDRSKPPELYLGIYVLGMVIHAWLATANPPSALARNRLSIPVVLTRPPRNVTSRSHIIARLGMIRILLHNSNPIDIHI